jgi:hypothetical protein
MEFDNSYFKKVKEVKTSLNRSFPSGSAINESFSGGLLRTSAKDTLNQLSIYHLLRGLEIDTSDESYPKLASMLPSCKDIFIESTAETKTANLIVVRQLEYVSSYIQNVEKNISKKTITIEESDIDFTPLKNLVNSFNADMINKFITSLSDKVNSNSTGLESSVYDVIDNLGLPSLKSNSFVPENIQGGWVKKSGSFDSNKELVSSDPIKRISVMLEMALSTMKIKGISYITYNQNPFEFLSSILIPLLGSESITTSELSNYKNVIDSVGNQIVQPEVEKLSEVYSENITIPSLQSLYIALVSFMTLPVIVKSLGRGKSVKGEIGNGEVSKETIEKTKKVVQSYNNLLGTDFMESTKVFYENKSYTDREKEMIIALKKFFYELGLITKNVGSEYLNKGDFDKKFLGQAVRLIQQNIKIKGKDIKVDGRIGKDTRFIMKVFMEDVEKLSNV